jgi:hypothetical protein
MGVAELIYFFVCGTVGMILWIKMLKITKRKGFPVNYGFVYPGQYIRFWKIIKNEENPSIRNNYKLIFWGQMIILIVYPIGMIIIMGN